VAAVPVPASRRFFNAIIATLRELGGSGTREELKTRAPAVLGLSDEVLNSPVVRHAGTSKEQVSNIPKVYYRVGWALSVLKKTGYLENSSQGVWSLTKLGLETDEVDPNEVVNRYRLLSAKKQSAPPPDPVEDDDESDAPWREQLQAILTAMKPDAFERLAQRLLREAGFENVTVTGRSGDGGIDGRGVVRLNGLVTMNAVFQCKRYQNSVGPSQLRDFRGAMMGKADRGIFVTTSTFTSSAIAEAMRDGVPTIDLIDGDQLVELLKKFQIGVKTEMVEAVSVDSSFFNEV